MYSVSWLVSFVHTLLPYFIVETMQISLLQENVHRSNVEGFVSDTSKNARRFVLFLRNLKDIRVATA